MQHRFLVLSALICATNSYGAASSSNSSASLEGTVYAWHNPTSEVVFVDASGIRQKKLVLLMGQPGVISLKLKENYLHVGKRMHGPLSVHVAGGYPEGNQDNEKYTYKPVERFYVLCKCPASSGTNMYNQHQDLQELTSLAAVMSHIREWADPGIVVDLHAWLDTVYGEARKDLPVRMVPSKLPIISSDCDYTAEFLTQAQLDERQRRDEAGRAAPVAQWFKELFTIENR